MSNTIVIELCAEDRARLDRLAEAMERKACDKCVATAMEFAKLRMEQTREQNTEPDPIQQKLAATLAKANEPVETPKNAVEEEEVSTPTTTPIEEEKPTEEEPAQEEQEKTVTKEELMAKVIELSAKDIKLKAKVRDIVLSYAPRVKAVPEDMLNECYEKLVALEG